MDQIESRLTELGLTLPAPLTLPGNFQLVKMHNGLAYIAGHGTIRPVRVCQSTGFTENA